MSLNNFTTAYSFRFNNLHTLKLIVGLLLLFFIVIVPVAAASDGNHYGGQATVVQAQVFGLETTLVEAGPLSSHGGAAESTLLEAQVPDLLNAKVLHASTVGHGNHSRSEASVADVDLTVGGHTISAELLMARASASCENGTAHVSGQSHVANLVINGKAIDVSGHPNQTIELPGVRVVVNEQTSSTDGQITVTALHVIVDHIADIAISTAEASIQCVPEPPPPPEDDFVTGGGFITGTPTGKKANFGVAGGIKKGDLWGHLTYIDRHSDTKVKATSITGYTIINDTTRKITGTALVNGQDGYTFEVIVSDNGEPGKNDTFHIQVSNGYAAGGMMGGGNIQLHHP